MTDRQPLSGFDQLKGLRSVEEVGAGLHFAGIRRPAEPWMAERAERQRGRSRMRRQASREMETGVRLRPKAGNK